MGHSHAISLATARPPPDTPIVPDYAGDRIVSSIGGMLATAAGFLVAAYLPVALTLLLVAKVMLLPHDNPWIALN